MWRGDGVGLSTKTALSIVFNIPLNDPFCLFFGPALQRGFPDQGLGINAAYTGNSES